MNNRFLLPIVVFLGSVSLFLIAVIIIRGIQRPQNATPSRAAETANNPTNCQGNKDAPAKCFDCKIDAKSESQINILDFSCFAKFYGKDVGKP